MARPASTSRPAVITKGQNSGSFDVLQRSAPISGEVLRIFQSTEGSLSAKLHITISRFDVRGTARHRRVAGTHTRPPLSLYSGVSPSGIRQGYRGCSGVLLVVIGVGRTDHLNTRHCNHDSPPPRLALSRCSLPQADTLFAYRTVIAPSHPRASRASPSGEYLQIASRRPTSSPFVSIVASSDLREDIARISQAERLARWIRVTATNRPR